MKTFEEFLKDVERNAELMAKLKAALAKVKTAEEKAAAIVKLAKESGYDVSVEDLSAKDAKNRKLDDEELMFKTGGFEWIWESDELCWENYGCAFNLDKQCKRSYRGKLWGNP